MSNAKPSAGKPRRGWWSVSVRSGLAALLLGAAACVVVSVVCWLPDAGVSGRPASAIRAGLLAFLAGQGAGITLDGVYVLFVPLAISIAVALVAWRAGRTLAVAARDGGETEPRRLLGGLAAQVAAYAAGCGVLAHFARLGTTSVSSVTVIPAAIIMFGLFSGAAVLRFSPLREQLRLPALGDPVARAVLAVVVLLFAAGALLTTASVIVHAARVMDLSRQVGGGLSGLPVLVLGVLCAPNAAVAGSAYLTGPGFAVGSETTISPLGSSHGVLPAFPILGAVPDGSTANTLTTALGILTLLAAGAVAALVLVSAGVKAFVPVLKAVGSIAVSSGVVMAILAWRSGGSVGDDRLSAVGASPWRMAVYVALEVGASMLVSLGLYATGRWLISHHSQADATDERPARTLEKVG
ncbi:MAG: hypothetical protein JO147_09740 [Actinobacteria bacterium]|nr:hypothetical protein [Actinomycetota bacterium]